MAGILYGVGVGPGDPELITRKAERVLSECDEIGIPTESAQRCRAYRIAVQAVPGIADKPILAVPVPMTRDRRRLAACYKEGSLRIEASLREGSSIAFLNLGDPCIYGTYMELHRLVRADGYEARIISGVPSFCAVAAALELPLGRGSEAIHILPGQESLECLTALEGTKVLMKSAGRMPEVVSHLTVLEEQGLLQASAVTDCGMPGETICSDIAELDPSAGYFTTILVREANDDPGA